MTGVECEEVETGTRHGSAQLSDISLTGVFLYGVPVLPEGTRLRLRFTLPSLQMQVDAAVVHTTPAGGMGLTFLNLTPVHRVVIQELMRSDEGGSAEEAGVSPLARWAEESGSLETIQLRLPVTEDLPVPGEEPIGGAVSAEETAAGGAPEAGSPPDTPPAPAGFEGGDGSGPTDARAPEVDAGADAEAREDDDDVWPPPLPPLPELRPAAPPADVGEPSPVEEPEPVAEPEPAAEPAPPATAGAPLEAEPPAPPTETDAPAPGPDGAAVPPPDAEGPARRPRVLVVDDHDRTRTMLRGMIEGRDKTFEVTEASDGEDCLRIIEAEGPFDLIFLDVDMPRLDGLGACRELRARGVRSPIIFLTGRSELGDFRAGRDAGGDTYIKKPIVLGTLRSMLSLFTSGSLQRR